MFQHKGAEAVNKRKSTWWCEIRQNHIPLDGYTRPVDDETAPERSEEVREVAKGFWDSDSSWDLYCATGFERHRVGLLDHQLSSESMFGQTRESRVEASDALLGVGHIAAGAIESEARTLRRLIVEARNEIVRSIISAELDRDGVGAHLEDIIEHHVEKAVVTARLLERPEDSYAALDVQNMQPYLKYDNQH